MLPNERVSPSSTKEKSGGRLLVKLVRATDCVYGEMPPPFTLAFTVIRQLYGSTTATQRGLCSCTSTSPIWGGIRPRLGPQARTDSQVFPSTQRHLARSPTDLDNFFIMAMMR